MAARRSSGSAHPSHVGPWDASLLWVAAASGCLLAPRRAGGRLTLAAPPGGIHRTVAAKRDPALLPSDGMSSSGSDTACSPALSTRRPLADMPQPTGAVVPLRARRFRRENRARRTLSLRR